MNFPLLSMRNDPASEGVAVKDEIGRTVIVRAPAAPKIVYDRAPTEAEMAEFDAKDRRGGNEGSSV